MPFQRSANTYINQLTALLLGLAICSHGIPLAAQIYQRTVPDKAKTKEAKINTGGAKNDAHVGENFAKLPLSFEPNQGQANAGVKFTSRGSGYTMFLTSDEVVLLFSKTESNPKNNAHASRGKQDRHTSALRMKLQNSAPRPKMSGVDELPGKSNYFIGNDPKKWRTDVPNFSKVKYENVYPGVDMLFYGKQQLEYDFIVAPNADTRAIRLKFEGTVRHRIDESGDLILSLNGGEIRSQKPFVYQKQEGQQQKIDGRYVITGKNEVGFEIGPYDRSRELIIDPVLMFSSYLGGTATDYGYSLAVDSDGHAFLSGETLSTNFPIANAYQPVLAGSTGGSYSTDAYVVKLSADGSQLLYSTFLGGGDSICHERGYGLAVDSSGNAFITGDTSCDDFPTANPFRSTWGGAFITKLNPNGNGLVYSSNIHAYDTYRVAVDSTGIAWVVGYFGPTGTLDSVNPIQTTYGGGSGDIQIVRVSASGSSLLNSTYLGGNGDERGYDVALDNDGNAYVTGYTTSTNLPVTNPYQSTFSGTGTCGLSPNQFPCADAFVLKLNSTLTSILYLTYLGGSNDDRGLGIRVDSAGHAFVGGRTSSTNFPVTAGAYDTTFGGEDAASGFLGDIFVTELDAGGNALVYSTYVGGNNGEQANGLALDSSGNVYVTGFTRSTNFPQVNALWSTTGVGADVFVVKINSTGTSLIYSTTLGGQFYEEGNAIAVDPANDAYVIGTTYSSNFPVVAPFQANVSSTSNEAFFFKISSSDGFTISGRVTDSGGNGVTGVTMTLNGSRTLTTLTDTNGSYAFTFLKPGETCTLTPTKNLYIFNPVNRSFTNLAANETADFVATTSSTTYTISGRVADSLNVGTSGITMTLTGSLSNVTQTDANGNYSFTQLVGSGNYTVTPSKTVFNLTYTFTPPSRTYTNLSANQVGDFSFTTSTTLAVNPIADLYVQDGASANLNFGTTTPLQLKSDNTTGQRRDVYFKFDISPVSRTILAAKLRIYAALSASGSISTAAHKVTDTQWSETAVTWNNKPARDATAISGATVAVTSTTFATYDIDISSYIIAEKTAGRNIVSLALHNGSNTTPHILLNSREAPTNKPLLVLTTSGADNVSPTVSLTAPSSGSFTTPVNITVSANASDTDGSVSKVDFYAGNSLINSDNTAPYSFQWNGVGVGAYAITAVATDNGGLITTSSPVNISVNNPNISPTVSISAPVGGLTFPAGSNLTLAANATDVDGSITKVDFYSGASLLGTDTTAPYSISWLAVAGAHNVTAVATDNAGSTGTSDPVSVTVVWQTALSPQVDAYVKDGSSAGTNFGTQPELQVQQGASGSNRESHLRFDLTAVNNIARATLRVYGRLSDTSGTNVPIGVYAVSNTTWIESGSNSITWNTKPTTGNLQSSTTITDNVARWYEFDVTTYVKDERNTAGHTLISFAFKSLASSTPYAVFNSKEETQRRPQLLLWTTQTRNALFAVGSSNLGQGDNAVKTRLENLGFTVVVEVANNGLITADADGKAVIVISSTVSDGNVNTKFKNVPVPVVNWEPLVLDDFGMTAAGSGNFGATTSVQTALNIINATHPLAAGLSGNNTVASPGTNFSWGIAGTGAVQIGMLVNEPTKAAIFGYDGGAAMPGLEAPARRVALFMTDVTANNFPGTNGGLLFDAALKWATEVITGPTITILTPNSGPSGTTVSLTGFNFGATQGTSNISFNGVVATPTTWTDKTIVAPVPVFATSGPVTVIVNGVVSNGVIFSVGDVDSDADGLPDWWELQYFGNLAQTANGDFDGDGLSNLTEYQQGRNPTKNAQTDDGSGVNLKVHTPLVPLSP